jgi:hypothetical protein
MENSATVSESVLVMEYAPLVSTLARLGGQEVIVSPVSIMKMIDLFIFVAVYCVSDLYGISFFTKIKESREEDFRGRRKLISFEDY